MSLLLSWAVLTLAFLAAAKLLPGVKINNMGGAIAAAAIFGVLNFFVGWLLFLIVGFATLGLGFLFAFVTRFVVDAVLLKVTDSVSDALEIANTKSLLLAALVIAAVGSLGQWAVELLVG
jgi:putative membrane protein